MDEGDGDGALADGRGDALDGLVADVAGGEHAGHRGFEQERLAFERPSGEVVRREVRAGADEPAAVARERVTEPVGPRRGADKDEQHLGLDLARVAVRSGERDAFEVVAAVARLDRPAQRDLDAVMRLDAVDEVLAHALAQVARADEHRHARGDLGEVERRLPGRVARAHDHDVLVAAALGLGHGRAVVDAAAFQAVGALGGQLAPVDAQRQHQRVARDLAAVGGLHDLVRPVGAERGHLDRRQDLDAEAPRLAHAAPREVGAREAGREAEVVLDPARRAGLPAGRVALDEHGVQPFGGAVDGARQARRPAADDGEVVEGTLGLALQAQRLGERARLRVLHALAAGRDHERQRRVARERPRLLVALDVEEGVGDLVARQEVAQAVAVRAPPVAHDADAAVARPVARAPVGEQVVQDGVEALLGRVPRFEQVVVDAALVDGRDRRVGVGVGREERALGGRRVLGGPAQDVDAAEAGHPLVREHERDGVAALGERPDGVDGLLAGPGADDAVVGAVAAAEVAGDGAEHLGVVVHDDDGGLGGVGAGGVGHNVGERGRLRASVLRGSARCLVRQTSTLDPARTMKTSRRAVASGTTAYPCPVHCPVVIAFRPRLRALAALVALCLSVGPAASALCPHAGADGHADAAQEAAHGTMPELPPCHEVPAPEPAPEDAECASPCCDAAAAPAPKAPPALDLAVAVVAPPPAAAVQAAPLAPETAVRVPPRAPPDGAHLRTVRLRV